MVLVVARSLRDKLLQKHQHLILATPLQQHGHNSLICATNALDLPPLVEITKKGNYSSELVLNCVSLHNLNPLRHYF